MFHTIKAGEEYATLPDAEFLSAIKEFLPSGSDVEQREDNGLFVFHFWRGTDHYQQFTLEAMDRNAAATFAAAFAAGVQHVAARDEMAKDTYRTRVELEGNLTRVDMLTVSALGGLLANYAHRTNDGADLTHNALDMAMHAECALLDLHVARHGPPWGEPVTEGDTGHVDLRVDGEAVAVFTDGTESGKPLAVHSDGVYVEHTGGNVSVVPLRDFLLHWSRVLPPPPPIGWRPPAGEPPAGGGE